MTNRYVTVRHTKFDRKTGNPDGSELVAIVDIPEDISDEYSFEYAYMATQNRFGSWSKGKTFVAEGETIKNEDYNPNVTVVMPLEEVFGTVYGHRSSMVNDVFTLFFENDNGDIEYHITKKCGPVGFIDIGE